MINMNKYRYWYRHRLSALALSLMAVFLLPCSADARTQTETKDGSLAGTAAVTADTSPIYGIGSVSKMFVTAAVMRLKDQGLIDLDTPVITYIPEFRMADERYRLITVRMLLNHSSGLMGTTFENCFLYGSTDTDYHRILLDHLNTQRLKADPGDYSVYCNDGFTLAELIVERVSGLSFAQYIDQAFSIPLSLNRTFMPADIPDTSVTAPIYYRSFELPRQNTLSLASGGIYSTPSDLCRFAAIFTEQGKGLLSDEALEAMASPEYLTNKICARQGDSNFNYGLGWDSVEVYPLSKMGIQALSKGGDIGNYGAGLIVLPKLSLSAAVTASGGESTQCLVLAEKIILEVLREEGLITEEQIEAAVTIDTDAPAAVPIPDELNAFQGIYAASEIWELTFTERNTALLTSLENNSDAVQEYIYTQDGSFVSTDGKYISYDGLSQASNGTGGYTSFRFSEEENGKTYMLGTTYTLHGSTAENALTMPFAEKIEENPLSDAVLGIWSERNEGKYYLISEPYNSSYYLKLPCTVMDVMERFQGYTGTASYQSGCRILDENNAVKELDLPVMVGRDQSDYHFYQEAAAEYLTVGGYTFIEEEALPVFSDIQDTVELGSQAVWYRIDGACAGKEITIDIPADTAWYIFNKDDICTAGSLFLNQTATLLLPEDGKIVFVGKEGSRVKVNG